MLSEAFMNTTDTKSAGIQSALWFRYQPAESCNPEA